MNGLHLLVEVFPLTSWKWLLYNYVPAWRAMLNVADVQLFTNPATPVDHAWVMIWFRSGADLHDCLAHEEIIAIFEEHARKHGRIGETEVLNPFPRPEGQMNTSLALRRLRNGI